MKKLFSRPAANLETAVFAYFSVCCQAVAKKAPLVAANKTLTSGLGARPEAEGTLGSWRCSACNKPCKCTRQKREAKPEAGA